MEIEMSVYFFGGINGVGKSTIIKEVNKRVPDWKVKHTSSMIMEWLGLEIGDYDGLRNLSNDYKMDKNNEMLSHYLQTLKPSDNVILDSHYLTLINGTTSKVIAGDWPQHITAFVLVDADVEGVYRRISDDSAFRERGLFPIASQVDEQIAMLLNYRKQTYNEFNYLAERFSVPKIILSNNADVSVTVDAFLKFAEQYS